MLVVTASASIDASTASYEHLTSPGRSKRTWGTLISIAISTTLPFKQQHTSSLHDMQHLVVPPFLRRRVFIIKELDDTHLLVKEDHLDFVNLRVKEFNNKNVYTPPVEQEK